LCEASSGTFANEEAAAKAWNRRAPDLALRRVKELETTIDMLTRHIDDDNADDADLRARLEAVESLAATWEAAARSTPTAWLVCAMYNDLAAQLRALLAPAKSCDNCGAAGCDKEYDAGHNPCAKWRPATHAPEAVANAPDQALVLPSPESGCSACFWNEGGRCYDEPCDRLPDGRSKKIADARCAHYITKREKMSRVIPGDMLVITSERNKTWWCCAADYPNHEPGCTNAAPPAHAPDCAVEIRFDETGNVLKAERYLFNRAPREGDTFIADWKEYRTVKAVLTFGKTGGVMLEHVVRLVADRTPATPPAPKPPKCEKCASSGVCPVPECKFLVCDNADRKHEHCIDERSTDGACGPTGRLFKRKGEVDGKPPAPRQRWSLDERGFGITL
jgi:hypothetical protein